MSSYHQELLERSQVLFLFVAINECLQRVLCANLATNAN